MDGQVQQYVPQQQAQPHALSSSPMDGNNCFYGVGVKSSPPPSSASSYEPIISRPVQAAESCVTPNVLSHAQAQPPAPASAHSQAQAQVQTHNSGSCVEQRCAVLRHTSAPQAPDTVLSCVFCRASSGSLLRCGVTELGIRGGECRPHKCCERRFHWLCAWFAGAFVRVSVSDASFTLGDRRPDGRLDTWPNSGENIHGYPAGLEVDMRCLQHSAEARGSKGPSGHLGTSEEVQLALRDKYRVQV